MIAFLRFFQKASGQKISLPFLLAIFLVDSKIVYKNVHLCFLEGLTIETVS